MTKKMSKKKPRITLKSRILAASKTGAPPIEIAKILGTSVGSVYVVRAEAKRKNVDTTGWYSQHNVNKTKDSFAQKEAERLQPKVTSFDKDAEAINKFWDQVHHLNAQPIEPVKQEPFSLPFFSRIKAAYAALKGDIK